MKKTTLNKMAIVFLAVLVASCSSNSHKSDVSGSIDFVKQQGKTFPVPVGPFELIYMGWNIVDKTSALH